MLLSQLLNNIHQTYGDIITKQINDYNYYYQKCVVLSNKQVVIKFNYYVISKTEKIWYKCQLECEINHVDFQELLSKLDHIQLLNQYSTADQKCANICWQIKRGRYNYDENYEKYYDWSRGFG